MTLCNLVCGYQHYGRYGASILMEEVVLQRQMLAVPLKLATQCPDPQNMLTTAHHLLLPCTR
jgi:hypothetical protein